MYTGRSEIIPGVYLNYLRLENSESSALSITLLTQLARESAAMNALIPFVLRRGTGELDDTDKISKRLEALGGAQIEPTVRRVGEVQCLGFYASAPRKGSFEAVCRLTAQMLLSPITRGGLLLQKYVEEEKSKLLSAIEEKENAPVRQCISEMCCSEDYAVDALGDKEELESINYVKLTRLYHDLLQQSPVEVIYCGSEREQRVLDILRDALITFPRGELDDSIGTDVRLNALEDEPRFIREEADVPCGKLVMGFRLGECMVEPDEAAIMVFTRLMGEGAICDTHKGIMLVEADAPSDSCDAEKDAILLRLDSIARGETEPEELSAVKAGLSHELMALTSDLRALEDFTLGQTVDGLDYGPDELAALIEDVTARDVSEIAGSAECDLIYFLTGDGCEDNFPDEEM